jgi:hypothetical protein
MAVCAHYVFEGSTVAKRTPTPIGAIGEIIGIIKQRVRVRGKTARCSSVQLDLRVDQIDVGIAGIYLGSVGACYHARNCDRRQCPQNQHDDEQFDERKTSFFIFIEHLATFPPGLFFLISLCLFFDKKRALLLNFKF